MADAAVIASQARSSFNGFSGLDLAGCITVLAARGHDPETLALLLPHWEQGMKAAAIAQRRNGDQ